MTTLGVNTLALEFKDIVNFFMKKEPDINVAMLNEMDVCYVCSRNYLIHYSAVFGVIFKQVRFCSCRLYIFVKC